MEGCDSGTLAAKCEGGRVKEGKGDPEMDRNKKRYKTPELVVHGDLTRITKRGGGDRIDVPEGTVVTSIAAVTS